MSDQGCWHLTLIAERALKILYFDGSSAAKMADGPMDSQDLVAWGKIVPEWVFNEKQRILDLCAWGEKYAIDGYVRMEMDFEVMLCSFTKGVKTVSFLNLSSENTRGPPARAPRNASDPGPSHFAPGRLPQAHDYRVIEAGSWHNRFPGDIRIELDYTRLVSFYDTASFPSLQPHRFGQERFFHRLNQVSTEDLVTLTHQLDEILGSQPSTSSGIQWRSLINVITNRYAERLEMLEYTLNATPANGSPEDIMGRSYRYVRSMLITYIVHDAAPSSPLRTAPASDRAWAQPVFEACVAPYSYSDIFVNADATSPLFSRSEELLASSVKSVVKEICRVLVSIWAEGVELGLQNNKTPELKIRGIDVPEIVSRWSSAVSDLIQWLDWSYWVRCKPSCSYDETCYLPTWPYFGMPGRRPPRDVTALDGEEPAWVRPRPKCIPRVEPYGL
ncbi:hypothetical protein BJ165DRAFT_1463321 [Panaeolus papilionaceus]|nr:hypothetical protein BJ165DRAFT_1463321 [Panaeolus papilionaceus]